MAKNPLVHIIFLNTTNGAENPEMPKLKVVFDGKNYRIVEGIETLKIPLAQCFENLGKDFYTEILLAIELINMSGG